ncbi:MAG: cytochrome C biogenesis protein CcdA [Methanomicrobiales archaeon]|nr:cytochrome C biogenesis protein CcdA [Methanomicrobiales archaeon]
MATFDPSPLGIFIFGLIAGICPSNSVFCIGLIGYLTGGKAQISTLQILKLTIAFSVGTILVLLPLGIIAGFIGRYLLFLSAPMAWSIGGILLIVMGLQLLRVIRLPKWGFLTRLRVPASSTLFGAFLLGVSFGGITIGRGAPMLIIVLTYIALSQTMVQGFFTILLYGAGLSLPLIVISSVGGALGQRVKVYSRISSGVADRIIGVAIILIGVYFLYLAFA